MTRHQGLRRALALVTVLALLALSAELAAHRWLDTHPPISRWDFFLTRPAAYQASPYWSPEFVREQEKTGVSDFHGRWYNIRYGLRQTVGQPAGASHSVYMFGNSTLYGTEVPDEYTIASQVQALLNDQSQGVYRVVNLAELSATAARQVAILRTVDLKPGDIVIFYDGVIDVGSIYTTAQNRRRLELPATLCTSGMQLALLSIACSALEASVPAGISDSAQLLAAVGPMSSAYRQSIATAAQYTHFAGAQFYHFIEPMLWTKELSSYEQQIATSRFLVPEQLDKVFGLAWPALVQSASRLPDSIDLTHVLDQARAAGQEMYLDCCHITERGNAIVAQAIYGAITKRKQ